MDRIGDGVGLLLVFVSWPSYASLKLRAAPLLNDMSSFVCSQLHVRLCAERDPIAGCIGKRPHLLVGLRRPAANGGARRADVVPSERRLDAVGIWERLVRPGHSGLRRCVDAAGTIR
jgi:hypothetical protein